MKRGSGAKEYVLIIFARSDITYENKSLRSLQLETAFSLQFYFAPSQPAK